MLNFPVASQLHALYLDASDWTEYGSHFVDEIEWDNNEFQGPYEELMTLFRHNAPNLRTVILTTHFYPKMVELFMEDMNNYFMTVGRLTRVTIGEYLDWFWELPGN